MLSVNLFVQANVAYVENSKHARVSKTKLRVPFVTTMRIQVISFSHIFLYYRIIIVLRVVVKIKHFVTDLHAIYSLLRYIFPPK